MNPEHIPKKYVPVLVGLSIVLALCILPAAAITVTDDTGMAVTLNTTPGRIVSLAPSNTEILAALGLLDRMVGVTDVCNYPPEVNNIPRIGSYSAISIEKVAASRPDLIIASDITPRETVNRLRGLGRTVVVVAPRNIGDVLLDIRMVGMITGTGQRADQLAGNLSDRLSTIALDALPSRRPTVAHVVWHDPLYVSGNDTLQNDVIVHAGGVNAFADRNGWGTVSLEEFLMKNPDIILVNEGDGMDASAKDVILDAFMNNPQYASLSAVKNHQVYAVNSDLISRSGPRIVDAVEQVARIIRTVNGTHPASQAESVATSAAKTPGFTVFAALSGLVAGMIIVRR
jgi:iron complex transport system substrate-binding protein